MSLCTWPIKQILFCSITGKALKYILHNNFKPNVGMRADSHKIAVLITERESDDSVTVPLRNLKDTGIKVYIIGDSLCQFQ